MNSRWLRNSFIYLLIAVAVIAIFFTLFSDVNGNREVPINELMDMARHGSVDAVEVRGDNIKIFTSNGETLTSRKEESATVFQMFESAGVDPVGSNISITVLGSSGFGNILGILLNFLPLIFFWCCLIFHDAAGTG